MSEPLIRDAVSDAPWADVPLEVRIVPAGDAWRALIRGELDVLTCEEVLASVSTSSHPVTEVDISEVLFMDCCGYGSLIASRQAVEVAGRQLQILGGAGQPARLLELIAQLESAS